MKLINRFTGSLCAALMLAAIPAMGAPAKGVASRFVHHAAGNPYLPLWEHLPDGEPRVFEDPDRPGKFRIYIIGSHDVRYSEYCGSDIRMWSAPVEDLSSWRDEGPIFTFQNKKGEWDIMYAPDLVEVREKDGSKTYYLYPHARGWGREAMVAKGKRPDGPFTPVNLDPETERVVAGSVLGFDPSIYVENITDPKDPDYAIGHRAYGYWGFQRSSAAQLDPTTMYSVRPGTEVVPFMIPAGLQYGTLRQPNEEYPCIYPGEELGKFNFFEASSIRKVGNKYVSIYSGYSGPDYGMGSSNSTLRYAYADTPLGPWKIGGVLVDSRGPELGLDGKHLQSTNGGHNTHGSIEQINGQWYVFYHRPPRNFGFARQAVVAPISVSYDEKSVADGGKVVMTGYDPYAADKTWTRTDSQGNCYTGAEVTSEGFHMYGLAPYAYYPSGIACYLSNTGLQQDNWDIWDNSAPVGKFKTGNVVGYKYFGFGGLAKAKNGIKPFAGALKGNDTNINLFLTSHSAKPYKVSVWMDAPNNNGAWKGTKIAEFVVAGDRRGSDVTLKGSVAKYVDGLKGKHAIYIVAEGEEGEELFTLHGLGFTKRGQKMSRPVVPSVAITVDGKNVEVPTTPERMSHENGLTGYDVYSLEYARPAGEKGQPVVKATSSNPNVRIAVTQATPSKPTAEVKATYKGVTKTYRVNVK